MPVPLTRKRLWAYRVLLLIAAPAVVLGLSEIGLRVFGYGYNPDFLVPDEMDDSKVRDNYRFAWRFFPPALARAPQPIRVERAKPQDVHRIVVLGGSAAMGDPQPAFGLVRVLQRLLEHRHPGESFEVINAAVTAVNSHVVLSIAQDCRRLDAGIWIVYMGNNEVNGPYGSGTVFGSRRPPRSVIRASLAYQKTRLGQWMASMLARNDQLVPEHWGGLEMFLDQQVTADDPDMKRVYANFEANLDQILSLARNAGVPVLLSTVAVNLEDSAPFMSQSRPEDTGEIERLLQEEQWAQVVDFCEEFINAHGDVFADLQFYLGTALVVQGKMKEAREAFQRACDLDTLRFRADSHINNIIRQVAAAGGDGISLTDGEQVLSRADANGIPGKEFFYEHVHLTFTGNYHLGLELAKEIEKTLGFTSALPWLSEEACAAALGFSSFHRREILQEMRLRLRTPPFQKQFGHDKREAEIDAAIEQLGEQLVPAAAQRLEETYRELMAKNPNDWVLRQQFAFLLGSLNELKAAAAQWEAVVNAIPHDPASRFQLGAMRNRLEQWTAAETALREAIRLRDQHPKAWNSLGICLSRQSRFPEAYQCFQKAVEFDPSFAEALMNWGMVLQNQGDAESARNRFERAVLADPNHVPSYVKLGQTLTKANAFERAAEVYGKIVSLLPEDPGARINLALVHLKLGHRSQAIDEFQTALALDPGNRLAREYLGKLQALEE